MNHGVDVQSESADGEGEESPEKFNGGQPSRLQEAEWAQELRRADERSHEVRLRCEDLKKANANLESTIK